MLLEKDAAKPATAPKTTIATQIQPYLFFNGRCEEALAFYKKALGAEVQMLMRWKENPQPPSPEMCAGAGQIDGNRIMHACMKIGESQVMASDGMPQEKSSFQRFSLSLTARNDAECDRLFGALAEGGQVLMPLGKTFFAQRFGMVADRFGVSWMVIVPPQQ
jgi:PhnB protein